MILFTIKANGELRPKVFKLSSKTITPNARIKLSNGQPLKQATTRSYYKETMLLNFK